MGFLAVSAHRANVKVAKIAVKPASPRTGAADKNGMSQITQGWDVGEQQKFLSRIGGWFRRSVATTDDATELRETRPLSDLLDHLPSGGDGGGGSDPEPEPQNSNNNDTEEKESRGLFLRPWAKRDQAIDNLNRGIGAMADLLTSIRENMDRQSQRQEELLNQLTGLPEALKSIPETGRVQTETLQAISLQLSRQGDQQSKLGDVLERISQADLRQGNAMEALHQTVASLSEHDEAISGNLTSLGIALESITTNSQSSAHVLERLRDNTDRRDGELERILRKQNTRFTTMLTVAIVLSVSALTAVSVFGYLAYDVMTRVKP